MMIKPYNRGNKNRKVVKRRMIPLLYAYKHRTITRNVEDYETT